VVAARNLDEPSLRQVLRKPAAVADVHEHVVSPVQDEGRCLNEWHHMANVGVDEHEAELGHHAGARAAALPAAGEGTGGGIVGAARDACALSPERDHELCPGFKAGRDRSASR